MTTGFALTEEARDDLFAIWSYVFEFERSEQRADQTIDELYGLFATLSDHPDLGSGRAWLPREVLAFPRGRYVVLYRKHPPGIEVLRVSSGALDLIRSP